MHLFLLIAHTESRILSPSGTAVIGMIFQCPLLSCVDTSSSMAFRNLARSGCFIAWCRCIVSPTWLMSAIGFSMLLVISLCSICKLSLQSSLLLHKAKLWVLRVLACSRLSIILVVCLIIWPYLDLVGALLDVSLELGRFASLHSIRTSASCSSGSVLLASAPFGPSNISFRSWLSSWWFVHAP